MSKILALLLIANIALFFWSGFETSTLAQQPPETDLNGVPYLRVNINPTPVPPMVNINPAGRTPQVEVTSMPDLMVEASGCDRAANFETAVAAAVDGPIRLGFLNLPQPASVTLTDGDRGTTTVTLNSPPQLGSAIYLRSGQRLEFGSEVLYSGCRP
jgi:hypothetical protein